jgi:hypothetical protein
MAKSPEVAIAILEKNKKKPEPESDVDAGLESAAESLIAAVKAGDTAAVVESLRSFVEQCGAYGDDMPEEDNEA